MKLPGKPTTLWQFALATLCFWLSICVAAGETAGYTVMLTAQQIESQLQAVMPVTRRESVLTVSADRPRVHLPKDSQRLGLGMDLLISGPLGIRANGDARVSGGLRYDRAQGAFFLDQARLEALNIQQVPQRFHAIVRQVTESILVSELRHQPVYQFRRDQLGDLARAVLRSVSMRDGKLLLVLGPPGES